MAGALGQRLISAGKLTPEGVTRAIQHQKQSGQRLGECLVELELVSEHDVLRLLAGDFNTRFVSTRKLAAATISLELLEKVPVRLAEARVFMPLRLDGQTLEIVSADPQRRAALDEIAQRVGVPRIRAFLGLRSTVQKAIRKHYYRDKDAFGPPAGLRRQQPCRGCGTLVSPDDFQCPRCELLLNADPVEVTAPGEISVVRALLSIRDGSAPERPAATSTAVTQAGLVLIPDDPSQVPHIAAGLSLVEHPLHAFEAHLLSFVDGRATLGELERSVRVSRIEVMAMLASLRERGVVRFGPPGPAGPPLPVGAFLPDSHPEGPLAAKAEAVTGRSGAPVQGRVPVAGPGTQQGRAPGAGPMTPAPPLGSAPVSPSLVSARRTSPSPAQPLPAARPPPPTLTPTTPGRGTPPARAPLASGPRAPTTQTHTAVPGRAGVPLASTPPPPTGTATGAGGRRFGSLQILPPQKAAPPPPVREPVAERASAPEPPWPAPSPSANRADSESILERVVAMERSGLVDEAIDLLRDAIGSMKQPAPFYNRLALILMEQRKDYRRAEALLRKAVELDPDNSVFELNLYTVLSVAQETSEPGKKKRR